MPADAELRRGKRRGNGDPILVHVGAASLHPSLPYSASHLSLPRHIPGPPTPCPTHHMAPTLAYLAALHGSLAAGQHVPPPAPPAACAGIPSLAEGRHCHPAPASSAGRSHILPVEDLWHKPGQCVWRHRACCTGCKRWQKGRTALCSGIAVSGAGGMAPAGLRMPTQGTARTGDGMSSPQGGGGGGEGRWMNWVQERVGSVVPVHPILSGPNPATRGNAELGQRWS